MSLIKKLSALHEADVAQAFSGHASRGSGNQWHDQADGHTSRYALEFSFAWDCKCAMPGTKSIGISREMIEKIEEQAHGERPALPLRWYETERGKVSHDWIAVRTDDFYEMRDRIASLTDELAGALAIIEAKQDGVI